MDKDEKDYLYVLGRTIEVKYREKFSSQNAFAKAVGCDNRTIRRVIRGEQNVSLLLLRKIAQQLEVEVQELLV